MPNKLKLTVVENKGFFPSFNDIMNTASVRSFDRYILGPFLIWYGLKSKKMGKWPRRLIVTAGIYQLFYNWKEYRGAYNALQNKDAFKQKIIDISKNYEII